MQTIVEHPHNTLWNIENLFLNVQNGLFIYFHRLRQSIRY